jgi:L,D-transpeptidase-like protein
VTLIISLRDQKIDIYRGTLLIATSKVSTGMRGYTTKPGVFSILEKQRYHHSNMYSGAPMPWMQRLTRSGTALHGGVVPGFPASHGCIRLPFSFAPELFQITSIGDNVVVAEDGAEPTFFEHPNLFQPPASRMQSVFMNADPAVLLDESSESNPVTPAQSAIKA